MAENKRLHIQHYYTTGSGVPTADNVKLGEIAVGAGKDNEKLIIKNNENGIVKFLPEGADTSYIKTNGNTSLGTAEGGINIDGSTIDIYQGADVSVIISDVTGDEKAQLYSYGNYVEATADGVTISTDETNVSLNNSGFGINVKEDGTDTIHTLTFNDLGTLKVNGKRVLTDAITGVTAGNGLTDGGSASSGATGVTLNVGAGTGIAVDENSVSISEDYQEKIGKGVEASTKIDAFLKDANMTGTAIDTLVELQGYINSDSGATQTLLNKVDNLEKNKVTEETVNGWGFTKNTGTYSKPSGGIPKTDLASAVQDSLDKAESALQSETYKGTVTSVTIEAGFGLTGGGTISAASGSTGGTITIGGATATNKGTLGVSALYDGDLKDYTYQDGAAAAAAHTHSQYLTGYTEQYKGTITGVTAGSGLTGGGSAVSGASSVTISLENLGDVEVVDNDSTTIEVKYDNENYIYFNVISSIAVDNHGRVTQITKGPITTISCGTF